MNQREAFEKQWTPPPEAKYDDHHDEYNWVDYPSVNHPFNELYEAFKDGWYAVAEED